MNVYIDSSALVAVYVPERFSAAARASIRAAGQVPFTALHRLEVLNTFEMLVGRKLMTEDEGRALEEQVREDLDNGRLLTVPLDFEEVFAGATELSRLHTARLLTRSLDLLHVAAARTMQCRRFVSADARQLKVARAAGLVTVDITRPIRRSRA